MFEFEDGRLRARLNSTRVRATAIGLGLEDNDLFKALDVLDQVVAEQEHTYIHLDPGDGLLVDDTKIAHARTAFESVERLLIRVWIRRTD